MRKSAGFTLIELVIVIIILGILGAVAAPRLFNLQGDAYGANLNAMKSSISTAATMANAKAQIQGELGEVNGTSEKINGYDGIAFKFGYPTVGTNAESDGKKWEDGIIGTLENFETGRYKVDSSTISAVRNDHDALQGIAESHNAVSVLTISPATIVKGSCQVVYVEAYEETTGGLIKPAAVYANTTGC